MAKENQRSLIPWHIWISFWAVSWETLIDDLLNTSSSPFIQGAFAFWNARDSLEDLGIQGALPKTVVDFRPYYALHNNRDHLHFQTLLTPTHYIHTTYSHIHNITHTHLDIHMTQTHDPWGEPLGVPPQLRVKVWSENLTKASTDSISSANNNQRMVDTCEGVTVASVQLHQRILFGFVAGVN